MNEVPVIQNKKITKEQNITATARQWICSNEKQSDV